MMFALPLSAMAADFDFYGTIQMDAWWIRMERFYEGTIDTSINGDTVFKDDSIPVVTSSLFPEGKFGIKFNKDRFSGVVEFGIHNNVYRGLLARDVFTREYLKKRKNALTLRKWYAECNLTDFFTLTVGQTYLPGCFIVSNQAFFGGNSFLNSGCLYTGQHPMFQITLGDPDGMFQGKLAFCQSDTFSLAANEANDDYKYVGETKLPKIEGSLGFKLEKGIFSVDTRVAGGFQKYGFVGMNRVIPEKEARTTVEAFVLGFTGAFKVWWFSPSINLFYGKNLGIYGVYVGDAFRWWQESDYIRIFFPSFDPLKNKMNNGTALEMNAVLNIKPMDLFSVEGGIGYVTGDHDNAAFSHLWNPQVSWYGQTTFTFFEVLDITAELGQYVFGPYFGGGRYLYWGTAMTAEF